MRAPSAFYPPWRYGPLTGRYAWRSRLESGIVASWDGALIEPDRLTVGDTLRDAGYRTARLGKWHFGWERPTLDGKHPNEMRPFGGGPVHRWFDSYLGVDVPSFTPYTWFEDDYVTEVPIEPESDAQHDSLEGGHSVPSSPPGLM
ncbi:MAG: arylsulfatase A [Candidatus Aldehydirespiratoraceae bacterium]|jgi:arylsulfatase A